MSLCHGNCRCRRVIGVSLPEQVGNKRALIGTERFKGIQPARDAQHLVLLRRYRGAYVRTLFYGQIIDD